MSSPCEKFKKNNTINPHTNRKILIGGPTYKALVKECSFFNANKSYEKASSSICDQFRRNETINPVTKNKIKIGGPVHKSLSKKCNALVPKTETNACSSFLKNQTINPFTGRAIKIGGPTHSSLMDKCEELSIGNKMAKKTLNITSVESKKVVERWFETTNLDEMFNVFKNIRSLSLIHI